MPNDVGNEVFFSEHLVHYRPQIVNLMVVDGHEDCAILPQQIPRQIQPWIHHVQPLRVEPAIGFGIRAELFAFCVSLSGVFEIRLKRFRNSCPDK